MVTGTTLDLKRPANVKCCTGEGGRGGEVGGGREGKEVGNQAPTDTGSGAVIDKPINHYHAAGSTVI